MRVSEAMTRDVRIASPNQNLHEIAQIMAEYDVGCLPVGENERLVGMITDRDITVRAVAKGLPPESTSVREVMSDDVLYCYDDQPISEVAQNMADVQVHRLPVLDRDKKLVGILALADIANCEGAELAGSAVCGISEPAHASAISSGTFSASHH